MGKSGGPSSGQLRGAACGPHRSHPRNAQVPPNRISRFSIPVASLVARAVEPEAPVGGVGRCASAPAIGTPRRSRFALRASWPVETVPRSCGRSRRFGSGPHHLPDEVLSEEADSSIPRKRCGRLIVARRRIVVEAVKRTLEHVHLVGHAIRPKRRLVFGPHRIDARIDARINDS